MKKTEKFNTILDECLERLLVGGETIDQCLQSYPEQAVELEPLLRTALAAKGALIIQPHPEFRARARYQFRSALQEVASPRKRPFVSWVPRWATVVIIVLVLLLAGGGVVAAAGGSMPDNPLYPVKLAAEEAQLALTPSDMSKAELHAELADERVVEIIYMADKGDAQQVEVIAQRLDKRLTKLARLASATREGGVPKMLATTEETRGGRDTQVKANNQAKLKRTLARYAINHPAGLRAALDKAPDSAKPALRRAVAVSVAGYEKALKALD